MDPSFVCIVDAIVRVQASEVLPSTHSPAENKALARRNYEALNQRNWSVYYELAAPDGVLHNASMTIQGLDAYKQFLSMYLTAFPDAQFTIEDLIAEGDRVVASATE